MVIQVVGCKYASASYICTYICKNEPESLKQTLANTIKKLPENATIRKKYQR